MTATRITVDNVTYRVLVEYDTLKRSFELMEGDNSGTAISGRTIRDILGTNYTYAMTVRADPDYPSDYDNFYRKISEPVDYHTITLSSFLESTPYTSGEITFEAKILSGSDTYKGYYMNHKYWDELEVTFEPMEPQRK